VPESRPAQNRPKREREWHDFSRAANPRKIVIPSEVKGLCVFTDDSDPHETLSLLNLVIPSKARNLLFLARARIPACAKQTNP
jgi:hypothetical protein